MIDPKIVRQAIDVALSGDWTKAVELNTEIIAENADNVDAYNRLGFAHLKLREFAKAKTAFQKALELDPYNQIATKHLAIIGITKNNPAEKVEIGPLSPLMFLEDPGKTKLVVCVNPAPSNVLVSLTSGQEAFLKCKKHSVEVRDSNDRYVGALPDDVAFKLIKYIEGGNTYQVAIKSVAKNSVSVIIRELSRGAAFASQPSFLHALPTATATFEPILPNEKTETDVDEEPDEEDDKEKTKDDEE